MEAKLSVNFCFMASDGGINTTYKRHDTERDDGYSDAGPEFIAPHRSKGKRKNIA